MTEWQGALEALSIQISFKIVLCYFRRTWFSVAFIVKTIKSQDWLPSTRNSILLLNRNKTGFNYSIFK